ncbi:YT521-B-like domain-containing protein [Lactifluus subvellereus]|nr:YT521-B-like domain-containing protein [Lactifluus subvellereus]
MSTLIIPKTAPARSIPHRQIQVLFTAFNFLATFYFCYASETLLLDKYPPAVISNTPYLPLPERSGGVRTRQSANYMCGNAPTHSVNSDMDHTLSPGSGIPPTTSRQQSQPHLNQSTQRQSSTRPAPSTMSESLYPAPHQDVPESHARSSGPPSAFTTPSPPYTPPPPFRQRASHTGLQYPLPHLHPSLHMVHSAPPFAFPRYLGTPGQEANMQHLAYAPPSIMSMPRQNAPVFPYQGPSPDPASPSQHTFTASPASPALPIYPHAPINPSPPPRSPLSLQQASAGSSGGVQHSTSYALLGAYTPVGYTTYAYPPTAFVPAPSIYGSHYPPHYAQSYSSPTSQENQGTWWYLPPGSAAAANLFEGPQRELHLQLNSGYSSPVQQHEDDQPSQTSPFNPSPPRKPSSRSRSGGLNAPNPETTAQTKTTKNASRGESKIEWHQARRFYPNPPVDRSEWVVWAGNVPSDATCDELRDFFNQSLPPPSPRQSEPLTDSPRVCGGVTSVFLIARSNCAFVNFASEAQLEAATARFHGQPIRPNDPRCPRLVCRIRRRTDDLKAGVGAQRGSAMHVKWIKEQRAKVRRKGAEMIGSLEDTGRPSSPLSRSDDDNPGTGQVSFTPRSSRSGSFASTDSGILSRYFPQRYFILKSLTQYDLDLSVQKNLWASQRHNEEILDQAYRTSKDVFLIFGVNKSREFYGYARMAGPILQGENRVPWASRSTSPLPSRVPVVSDGNANSPVSFSEGTKRQDPFYISRPEEQRVVEESPQSISPPQEETSPANVQASSAPAELREPHQRLIHSVPNAGMSLPRTIIQVPLQSSQFELDADAPYRAMKDFSAQSIHQAVDRLDISAHEDVPEPTLDSELRTVTEEPTKDGYGPGVAVGGRPFRVNWVQTNRLPFLRTRHLRNPWNHGREVKVSRDGTELEPSIGQQLLEEWERPPPSPPDAASSRTTQRHRGLKPTEHPP